MLKHKEKQRDTRQRTATRRRISRDRSGLLTTQTDPARDSYGSLQFRDFRLLLIGVFLTMFARQMITVAIGWELYERTGSALILGESDWLRSFLSSCSSSRLAMSRIAIVASTSSCFRKSCSRLHRWAWPPCPINRVRSG